MRHEVRTTCPYCGVGCGISAEGGFASEARIVGDSGHPANRGRLCSKGSALADTIGLKSRLLHPIVRGNRASWDEALGEVAERFLSVIREHGPDAVAFYVSGQLLTEDYYVANKLMKGFIGSGNIDTNSRLCMSSAVAGHKLAFGEDVVPGCYEDFELADLVVLVGSNTAWCHPVLYQRLQNARTERGTKVVVIDPRRTSTCDEADLHIALKPGTDVRLFNALLAQLVASGALDEDYIARHTVGLDAALPAAHALDPSPDAVARDCAVSADCIETFFAWCAKTERMVTAFSQGVNQSTRGVDKVNSIINCHLATGRIGRPGMGPFSITGQPNAMGGREVGGLATQLAAHMEFTDGLAHARVARFWRSDNLAHRPGLPAVDMFRAAGAGKIRALWIIATNPAVSLPDANGVKSALEACEFVAISDCVAQNDTLAHADVVLPALAWGEKDGTVTNSERCISRQRAFLPAPGEARADWRIICDVAARMGFGQAFDYGSPADIFREHAALSAFENFGERAFDIGGLAHLSDEEYDQLAPVQWPVRRGTARGTPRLFGGGAFPTHDGRARFVAVRAQAPAHAPDADFPFVLNTGRVRDQWHTMTRTGQSTRLARHRPEPFVEIHPDDAALVGLKDGVLARLSSKWGAGVYRVAVTAGQKRGNLFAPIHWTEANSSDAVVGRTVNPACDAISGQPEFKHTPVAIDPVETGWHGFFLSCANAPPPACDYWTRIPVENGVLYELAGFESGLLPTLELLAGPADGAEQIEIVNHRRSDYRVARLEDGRLTHCLILTSVGALPPREWLAGLLSAERINDADRAFLLAGRAAAGATDEGELVCACFGVGRKRIIEGVAAHRLSSVEAVGQHLKAGTNCGSCRPEIRVLVETAMARSAA